MSSGIEEFLTVIDRVVHPITERMGRMESKLDEALRLHEVQAVQSAAQIRTDARVLQLEQDAEKTRTELATAKGRNLVINWILGLIGAPLVVALAGAGIIKVVGLG